MPKTITAKQLAANRANAQKSTGPRTVQGREVSKMNGIRHGIRSMDVVAAGRHVDESPREFKRLHAEFWEALKPEGALEEMLADQIVTAHWRLRRALKVESGEIALGVEDAYWEQMHGRHPRTQWLFWEAFGDPVPTMLKSHMGCSLLESWLRKVRESVEKEGELTEAATKIPCGGRPNGHTDKLEQLRLSLQLNTEGLEPAALREGNKTQALAYLDREIRGVGYSKDFCFKHEESEKKARQACLALPSTETLEKIQRYEAKLERQMFRAMAQLERLQRMRRGENVTPPVSVAVA